MTETLHRAAVALGANLGNPVAALRSALDAIGAQPGTRVSAVSSFYRTAPVDSSGPDYVNAVCLVQTTLAPKDLLHALQAIENAAGRVRPAGVHNAPRTLDLDVLTYDDVLADDPELILPHPRMHERAFVLVPLTEIAPDFLIPGKGAARALLASVAEQRIERMR